MRTTRKQESGSQDWMSLGDAGRALGRTRLAVLSMIARGELIGESRSRYTFVRRESVQAIIDQRNRDTALAG